MSEAPTKAAPIPIRPAPAISRTSSLKGKEKSTNQGNGSEGDEEEGAEVNGDAEARGIEPPLNEKKSRGSRACFTCRKVKMRCIIDEEGPPCQRCITGGVECIFPESMRGRKATKKPDTMAKSLESLEKMEATLETVLKTMKHPFQATLPHHVSFGLSQGLPVPSTSILPPSQATSASSGPPPPFSQGVRSPSIAVSHSIHSESTERESEELQKINEEGNTPIVHSLPADSLNPLGLLAEASLRKHRKRPFTEEEVIDHVNEDLHYDPLRVKSKTGVANKRYFHPGSGSYLALRKTVIEQKLPVALLVDKHITTEEAVDLFKIYFQHCHMGCPLLNPELHTPTETCHRSPFLFTAICTIASRYYTKKPQLYHTALKVTRKAAVEIMSAGFKSTEIAQGFLLMCHWNPPEDRLEHERVYLLAGIAIRMAADLNLNRISRESPPVDATDEVRYLYEREIANRTRCWLYAFVCDRRLACQMGKMHFIPREDPLIHGAKNWWRKPNSLKSDFGFCAIVELHRVTSRILEVIHTIGDSVNPGNTTLAYSGLLPSFLDELDRWKEDWADPEPVVEPDLPTRVSTAVRAFFHSYYRLFVLSFGLQSALATDSDTELPQYAGWAFEAAARIINIVSCELAPIGFFRYASDSSFVYVSYACCFFLKLVQMTESHATFINVEKAMELIEQGVAALEFCAVDDTHTPALYASFIRRLLDDKREGKTGVRSQPQTRLGSESHTAPGSPVPDPLDVASEFGQPGFGQEGHLGALLGHEFDDLDTAPFMDFWASSSILFPGFNPDNAQSLRGGFLSNDPIASDSFFPSRAGSPTNGFDFHV